MAAVAAAAAAGAAVAAPVSVVSPGVLMFAPMPGHESFPETSQFHLQLAQVLM